MTLTTPAKRSQWQPLSRAELLWFGLIFALIALIPAAVFRQALPCSDDTLPHFYRTVQLDVNLRQGAPFLQWGPEMLRGYGYTIFLFYAPLTYWLLEAIHLLGFDFGPAMQIAFAGTLWLAGWGAYALARHFLKPPGAFVAGLAYLFAPYLLYDAIQRGALPETLALALAPWALAAALRALNDARPPTIALAALLFAALILAHNVVPLFTLGLVVLLALAAGNRSSLCTVALILGFALGLTLFFWLPGLAELPYTQSRLPDPPLRDWPRWEQHIIPPRALVTLPADPADPNLLNPPIPRTLGIAQAVLGMVGMAALFWDKRPSSSTWPLRKRQLLFLAAATLAAIFFSSQWAFWSWQHLPLLNFIQMPTRFLGLASLGLAIFSGAAVEQFLRWLPGRWGGAAFLLLAAAAVSLSGWAWLYPRTCPVPAQPTRTDLAQATTWSRWYAEAQAELLPRWVQEMPPEDGLIPQYRAGGEVDRLLLPETAVLREWQSAPAQDTYRLRLAEPAALRYQTFYFPGWRAELDGRPLPITVTAPEGFMQMAVPAGDHTLAIRFAPTPIRQLTLLLSVLTAAALILFSSARHGVNSFGRFKAFCTPCLALLVKEKPPRTPFPAGVRRSLPLFFAAALLLILLKFALADRLTTPLRADRLQNGQLDSAAYPAAIRFDNEFANLGYSGPEQTAASDPFVITQYWTPLREIGVPYGFSLQVVDEAGRVWNAPPGRPFNYTHFPATELWRPGQYVRDAYDLTLLPGTPPGEYWLETAVFRRDTDLSLIPGSSGGSSPDKARLGVLRVTPGDWDLTPENAQVDTFAPTPVTAVPNLTLLGWTVPDVAWRPGEQAALDLLWQGDGAALGQRAAARVQLVDEAGKVVAETAAAETPPPDAETTLLRDKIRWRLPPALETGRYGLRLLLGGQAIDLGAWQIDAPPRTFEPPEMGQSSDFEVPFARLAGYTLAETAVPPGGALELALVWQAAAETAVSYRVFVHLLDENGALAAQSDAIPDHWTRPTTGWVPGEYVTDRHTLPIPADAPPGVYRLVVGFYNAADGVRVGEAEIGEIVVNDAGS